METIQKNGPMIEVSGLVKRYGKHVAVSDISFTVGRGEIVGLLGPNGAGKTTTMRILTCFLPATSGTVRVAGYDVFNEADDVRKRIGYMPENNPLHQDMRVKEYLRFRARLKGLSRGRLRERMEIVLEQCGLTEVTRKIIGQLSKGYKQRVGLADSLIHDPELIILDEPTIGLDPSQIRSVRELIKKLAGNHTVLISTHILPEVEVTCNRALIMRHGKIVAADSLDNLHRTVSQQNQVVAEILAPLTDLQLCWEQIPEVAAFDISPCEGDFSRCVLTPQEGIDIRSMIYDVAKERGWKLRELSRRRQTLEDIYLRVTRQETEEEAF
jgi:ABC-2 type transport system ATP-binding protein